MKHFTVLSKGIPAKAQNDHPDFAASIDGFLADPIGVIAFHIRVLLNKNQVEIEF